ncbi:Ionotropic glutamate receptor, L-glutamate and glycine-binding domain,Ionotropic glutamate receptor [Cinara cedri]|uniref:Ionotropic glutamate receptor, L-glutamate and glycine-binding domain,Ionotropic glutamate receptor n=1 Tax=Cinara cedri TaxID=506608 RepID=A0A5E4NML8_9HEMI|nr:Ionotropic glutamate receptor, L-glutamate and glycine-binding domain,Ionotropic glutamate receptor [Cinara cedri]
MIPFGTTFFEIIMRIIIAISTAVCWPTAARDSNGLLARCAVRLLNVGNPMRTTFYVTISPAVSRDFRTELLSAMHRDYRSALMLHEFDVTPFNPNKYIVPHAYLVVGHDASDLADHLDKINVTHPSWRPDANFVVVIETPLAELNQRVLEPVFRRFLVKFIFRSVLLAPPVSGGTVEALAWFPFRRRCGVYHTPRTVDTCSGVFRRDNNNASDDYSNNSFTVPRWNVGDNSVFEKRIPDVFNGCTVKIAAFYWPPMAVLSNDTPRTMVKGMDVEVVNLMSRIGNVKLELNEVKDDQRWGVRSANGTWNGGFGELSRHRADILIGGGILSPDRSSMFESAPARQVIRFPMYSPQPRKIPYWQNMLNVFSSSFWITLLVVLFLTSGLLWLSGSHLPSERRAYADCVHCFIISWAIFCSVSSGRQPTSIPSKIVFLSWVIYVLHISAVYTSMQLIYLYKPKYERRIRTIDEVKQSGLTVCCVPTFIPIAQSISKENLNMTDITPCVDIKASANRLIRQKDIIVLDPEDHFEAYISGSKVNKVEEVVLVYFVGIHMQKGSPYKKILTRAQIIAYETGLHNKWRRDAFLSMIQQVPLKKESAIRVTKLNFNKLQGAFIILICGLGISAIVFVLECFF